MPPMNQPAARSWLNVLSRRTGFAAGGTIVLYAICLYALPVRAQQFDQNLSSPDAGTPGSLTPETLPEGTLPNGALRNAATPPAGASQVPVYNGLTIIPSLGITESFTDNVRESATNRVPDFFTTESPALFVTDNSPRLQGVVSLAPQFIQFINTPSEDSIGVNGLVNGTATLVPDLFFLTANASANQLSRIGDQGQAVPDVVPSSQQTQAFAYSLAPYALFRLGHDIDGQVRYQFSQTLFNGNTGSFVNPNTGQTLPPLTGGFQNELFGKLQSDPASGTLQGSVSADALEFTSEDPLLSSRNINGMATIAYLVRRALWITAGAGYQDLTYQDMPRLNYIGPIWSVGFKYQPRPDRAIAISYGEFEGRYGFTGFANYALSPIVTLFGSYKQSVASMQQSMLQNLPDATQLIPGQTVDQNTGLPFAIISPNLALQNGIFFTTTGVAGARATYERNTFTLSANYIKERSLIPTLAENEAAAGVQFTWGHDLSHDLHGQMSIGYSYLQGAASFSTANSSSQILGSLGLSYTVSATLTATATYTIWNTLPQGGGPSLLVNIVTVGARKVF